MNVYLNCWFSWLIRDVVFRGGFKISVAITLISSAHFIPKDNLKHIVALQISNRKEEFKY